MTSAVTPGIPPDSDAMRRQLKHVSHGDLVGARNGLIELCWTDPRNGALSHAQLFGTDEIEDLIERAVELNQTPGVNTYVGAALRKPDAPREKRGNDASFYAASALWGDVDADVVAPAIATCKLRGVPPTMTVVTGRHPHLRAQMWWRLANPCRGPELLRGLCSNIAQAIGGDPSVVNPGRVLRLGGSVAWPTKDGRVLERTEVHIPDDPARPRQYFIEQLLRAFAPGAGPLAATPSGGGNNPAIAPTNMGATDPQSAPENWGQLPPDSPQKKGGNQHPITTTPPNGGLAIGGMSVEQAFAAVQRGERWHDHVVRLVAHWTARGWSDAEILGQAAGFTLPDYTLDQTRRDLARMIEGARRKWNTPNPVHGFDGDEPPAPFRFGACAALATALLKRREFMLGNIAVRGHVTGLVAPPGVGKSSLAIAAAVAVATGRDKVIGMAVHERAKAWVWNQEDDRDELIRRLAAVVQYHDIDFGAELAGRIGLNSGLERPLIIARKMREGRVERLPDADQIADIIKREGVGLLFVDPFVETHQCDENDNVQINAVGAIWREIAKRTNCAIVLVHHTAKPPFAAPDAWVGQQTAARGASSFGGVCRVVVTLSNMSKRDVDELGLDDGERRRWARLDDAKANLSLVGDEAKWFRRESVTIANGDEVGVLAPGDPKPPEIGDIDKGVEAAIVAEIGRAWRADEPYGVRPQSNRYWAEALPQALGHPARVVRDIVEALLAQGVIEKTIYDTRNKTKGLRVVPLDERRAPPPGKPPSPEGDA
jgi:hypothetical protein